MGFAFLHINLKFYRHVRELSQRELAKRAGTGFTQSGISRLECGHHPTDPEQVAALARALEVSVDTLLRRPRRARRLDSLRPVVLQEAS